MPETSVDTAVSNLRDEIVATLNRLADKTPFEVDDNVVGLIDMMFKPEHVENVLVDILEVATNQLKNVG